MKIRTYTAILSCVVMLLTGCGTDTSGNNTNTSSAGSADDYIIIEDLTGIYETVPYSDAQTAVLSQNAAMTAHSGFAESLAAIAGYPLLLEMDIRMEEAYERWLALPELDNTPKYGVVTNLPLDPDALYERVNRNTDAEIARSGLHGRTKLNEEDMRFCCEAICHTLNAELPEHAYPDQLDDIDANIANLTMFEGKGTNNAAIIDDGSMEFSRIMAENMIFVSGFEDSPKQIVAHETEHLMQKTSIEHMEELGLERSYAFMAIWEDMGIDPLYYNWMLEAAAERLAADLYEIEPMTYKSKIGYLDSMSFLAVLAGHDPQAFPKTTQQSGLDVVFDMFGCHSQEEKMELLYLLYTNEAIQQEPEEFLTAYETKLGHEMSEDELGNMKIELKVSLLSTMSRYFYRNLADLIAGKKLTFAEVCFLMSGWEMDVQKHISYTDSSRTDMIKPFLDYYTSMQQSFFESMAAAMETDAGSLAKLYMQYYANLPIDQGSMLFAELNQQWENVDLAAFGDKENAFINSFFKGLSENKSMTVMEYYQGVDA